jgi:hypothetical protein
MKSDCLDWLCASCVLRAQLDSQGLHFIGTASRPDASSRFSGILGTSGITIRTSE